MTTDERAERIIALYTKANGWQPPAIRKLRDDIAIALAQAEADAREKAIREAASVASATMARFVSAKVPDEPMTPMEQFLIATVQSLVEQDILAIAEKGEAA